MIDYLSKRPMIISAIGCCIISVCGFYSVIALFLAAVVFTLFLSVAIIKRKNSMVIAMGLILLVAISCFLAILKMENLNSFSNSKISATAVVCENTYKSANIYRSEIEVINSPEIKKGTRLYVWHNPQNFKTGEIIKAEIKLSKISEDYKDSNYSNGIFLSGNIISFERTGDTDPVLSAVDKVRKYIKDTLFENMDYESAATMCALTFGDRDYFTHEFYGNVKGAGVAHVMVVSGMHLSILVSMVLKCIEKIVYNPKLRALIMLMVVIALTALCGFTMSILRAGVTYIIMAIGLLLGKPYSGDNALGCAVTLILIFSPFAIFSVAFQLSALSTFGILAVGIPVCRYIESRKLLKNKAIKYIAESVIICFSSLLSTLPVTINIFGYISTVSVISNLLISYPVTVSLGLAVAGLMINLLFAFPANFLLFCADKIVKYINGVINMLGSQPFSAVRLPKWTIFISEVLIITVFCILFACKKRIDMLKLKTMNEKIIKERGKRQKWQSFMRMR